MKERELEKIRLFGERYGTKGPVKLPTEKELKEFREKSMADYPVVQPIGRNVTLEQMQEQIIQLMEAQVRMACAIEQLELQNQKLSHTVDYLYRRHRG